MHRSLPDTSQGGAWPCRQRGQRGKRYPPQACNRGGAADTSYGDCGSSYVQITPVGNRKALIQTGFSVYTGAVDFDWVVHVIDNYGVSNKTWGSPLAFRSSWVGTNNFTSSGTGYASAEVTYGVAFLWDGTICFSLGPFASTYIY
jgi:hypothetical protein